jgi:hypothetical protein
MSDPRFGGATTSQYRDVLGQDAAAASVEEAFLDSIRNKMIFIEESLITTKNRLVDAGFFPNVNSNTKNDPASVQPNDTKKDVIRNTSERLTSLCIEISDQVRQVC